MVNRTETKPARRVGAAASRKPAAKAEQQPLALDYESFSPSTTPAWVREVIETHLAIEEEDAKSAGALGFMARALVSATMPYKDPKAESFVRSNGNFRLRIVAGYEGGVPFGIYPRLLLSWVTSEAVRTQSPLIVFGDSLAHFLRNVLEISSRSGGTRGTATRVTEQMRRLFGSLITAQYRGTGPKRSFDLENVLIARKLHIQEDEARALWDPQGPEYAGQWQSKVLLTDSFYRECIDHPVPIDLRAYKALRGSPLAMDLYTWLTYRMSYTERRTKPIRWAALQGQFGTGYPLTEQGQRDFRNKGFLPALKVVQLVYPEARVEVTETGVVLLPSRPHVAIAAPAKSQDDLSSP